MNNYQTETRERNADFMTVCRRLIEDRRYKFRTEQELAERAASMPARRFYVTFAHAQRVLQNIRRGRKTTWHSDAITRQWHTLNDLVSRIESRRRTDFEHALMIALSEHPAPSFFIGTTTARRLFQQNYHTLKFIRP